MTAVLSGFVVVLAVVAVGWLVGRTGVLGPSGQVVLARVVFFVGTPSLLVHTLAGADVRSLLSWPLLVAAAAATSSALLFAGVARLAWRRSVEDVVVGALASGYVNAVNLGVPLAVYVLGDATAMAPALLFQLAVMAPVAVTVLDARAAGARRLSLAHLLAPLRNPLLIASVLGVVLGLARVRLPDLVAQPLQLLAQTAVPSALLAFGMSLHGGVRPRLGSRDVWTAAGLKLAVAPLVAWGVGGGLVGLRGAALLGPVLAAALPTAQNVFVYAVRYQRGVELARDAVLLSTLLSVPVLVLVAVLLG